MAKYFFNFYYGTQPKKVKPTFRVVRSKSPHDAIRLHVSILVLFFEFEIIKHDKKTVFTPYQENKVWNIL